LDLAIDKMKNGQSQIDTAKEMRAGSPKSDISQV
jgi:hypothetical protein